MTNALPLRPSINHTPRNRSVIDLSEESATEVLGSISSDTSQAILNILGKAPMTATDIADSVDTSVQNVHYHLKRLRKADIVSIVGTWYSSKGKEMAVYALTCEHIEIRLNPTE